MTTGLEPKVPATVLDYGTEKVWQIGSLRYTRRMLVTLFIWLLWGDLCFMLMEQVATQSGIVPLKLKALEAPNWAIGMIMGTIPSVLNTVLNPIVSFKSDRYRSRWGRRIPFIIATMPFLVACLVGVAFGDQIGAWAGRTFSFLGGYSANTLALLSLGVFMTLFAFFNVFVNSVFWYLFNDVVPEQLIGRFISWFRVILFFKGMLWSLLVFPYAESHFTEIMLGAAILYFVGFGAMCLFVREGEYPPPPAYVDGQHGAIAAIKTFGKECGGLSHYWYLFLMGVSIAMVWTSGMFGIFYQKTIGLDLTMIGQLGAIGSVAGLIAIPVSGWMADRYHPLRVVIWAFALQIFVATPLGCSWLFWQPEPNIVFWVSAVQAVLIGAPIGALMQMYDPPLLMRIFPRDRYGQFCSANAMCRSISGIVFGTVTGLYFDTATGYWGESISYKTLPIYTGIGYCFVLYFLWKLYRSWQHYGGDANYVAPLPGDPGIRGSEDSPETRKA